MAKLKMPLRLASTTTFLFFHSIVPAFASEGGINDGHFERWMLQHDRSYATLDEQLERKNIFLRNRDLVNLHNVAYTKGWTTYSMVQDIVESPFADWTDEEFGRTYLMEPQECSATNEIEPKLRLRPQDSDATAVSASPIDWRTHGIITPVKNQGHCGSCWTFSTTVGTSATAVIRCRRRILFPDIAS